MNSIVLALGGSILTSEDADTSYLLDLCRLLEETSKHFRLFVVIGGGVTARSYIKRGRELNYTEDQLDEIGISLTRVNAQLLSYSFSDANHQIPKTTEKALELNHNIIIMGGTEPGHSTDQVGAELAQKTQAERYIIATNVDGIYTEDPRKNPDTKKYDTVHIDTLISHLGVDWKSAGKNTVIDGPALQLIKDGKIPTCVVNGSDLLELKAALKGLPIKGTTITHE